MNSFSAFTSRRSLWTNQSSLRHHHQQHHTSSFWLANNTRRADGFFFQKQFSLDETKKPSGGSSSGGCCGSGSNKKEPLRTGYKPLNLPHKSSTSKSTSVVNSINKKLSKTSEKINLQIYISPENLCPDIDELTENENNLTASYDLNDVPIPNSPAGQKRPPSLKEKSNSITSTRYTSSAEIHKRPPLARAMSAPVRTSDEASTKNVITSKRKSRRKKNLIRSETEDCKIIETDFKAPLKCPTSKKASIRSRSGVSCDVVTLVSLAVSSEGSDSEREDNGSSNDQNIIPRPPFLRKTGKSVSFQENNVLNLASTLKDYPHMLRRGSIAPLASRLKANRPPTAPPVSVFLTDIDTSLYRDVKMSSAKKNLPAKDSKENSGKGNCEIYDYPEYISTLKERECWKLFQKMSNKGVTVSYETVLRGMLTPTEFRNIQKQKEKQEAKAASEQN